MDKDFVCLHSDLVDQIKQPIKKKFLNFFLILPGGLLLSLLCFLFLTLVSVLTLPLLIIFNLLKLYYKYIFGDPDESFNSWFVAQFLKRGLIHFMGGWMNQVSIAVSANIIAFYTSPLFAFQISFVFSILAILFSWLSFGKGMSQMAMCVFFKNSNLQFFLGLISKFGFSLKGCNPLTEESFKTKTLICDSSMVNFMRLPYNDFREKITFPVNDFTDFDFLNSFRIINSYSMNNFTDELMNFIFPIKTYLSIRTGGYIKNNTKVMIYAEKNYFFMNMNYNKETIIRSEYDCTDLKLFKLREIVNLLDTDVAFCKGFDEEMVGHSYNFAESIDLFLSGNKEFEIRTLHFNNWFCGENLDEGRKEIFELIIKDFIKKFKNNSPFHFLLHNYKYFGFLNVPKLFTITKIREKDYLELKGAKNKLFRSDLKALGEKFNVKVPLVPYKNRLSKVFYEIINLDETTVIEEFEKISKIKINDKERLKGSSIIEKHEQIVKKIAIENSNEVNEIVFGDFICDLNTELKDSRFSGENLLKSGEELTITILKEIKKEKDLICDQIKSEREVSPYIIKEIVPVIDLNEIAEKKFLEIKEVTQKRMRERFYSEKEIMEKTGEKYRAREMKNIMKNLLREKKEEEEEERTIEMEDKKEKMSGRYGSGEECSKKIEKGMKVDMSKVNEKAKEFLDKSQILAKLREILKANLSKIKQNKNLNRFKKLKSIDFLNRQINLKRILEKSYKKKKKKVKDNNHGYKRFEKIYISTLIIWLTKVKIRGVRTMTMFGNLKNLGQTRSTISKIYYEGEEASKMSNLINKVNESLESIKNQVTLMERYFKNLVE